MEKPRVLCVEDDNINAFIMEKLFSEDFDLQIVEDGEKCLNCLTDAPFDVILMDINLGRGKMDGIEILKQVRGLNGYHRIPVFAITSYALPGDEEKFLNAGFNSYFSKPIDRERLILEIQQHIND